MDLANFHPNKGDKRERSRVRDVRKISRKNKKRFFVLSSFPFWEFLKFVQNMRARLVEIANKRGKSSVSIYLETCIG